MTPTARWCVRGSGATVSRVWVHGGAAGEDGCAWQFAVFFLLSCLMYFSIVFFIVYVCIYVCVLRFLEAIAFVFAVRNSP